MRLKTAVTKLLIAILICIVALMLYLLINWKPKQHTLEDETILVTSKPRHIKVNMEHDVQYLKYYDKPGVVRQLKQLKKTVQQINEREHIINNKQYRGLEFDRTVLVIRVLPDIRYLSLFFDSIRRIEGIRKIRLLIFAHDYYDEEINKVIKTIQYARAIQIYYPYSIQLHPEVYPGEDHRYCEKLNQCLNSHKRNPVLSQAKLFWWWVANQVFDHIEVLKNYQGYIYFLETDKYFTRDFIVMAKLLESIQPKLCSECRFLSLGSYFPREKLYRPKSVSFIISAWGWSNYSNSGFGFNRTTWLEIKRLKQQFCYFRDPSWEKSLLHLGSKTSKNHLYTLFLEAPRLFPLSGCGAFRNGTECTLDTVYRDIVTFIATIRYWEGTQTFNAKLDTSFVKNEVEARGQWGDARDMDFCMFFSSGGRRLFY